MNSKTNEKEWIIKSPVDGKILAIEKVDDETFSKKKIGDGIAIIPSSETFYSPVKGELIHIHDWKHQYKFKLHHDIELIMHIGVNLSKINAKHDAFGLKTKVGKHLKWEDIIVDVDLDKLKDLDINTITPLAVQIKNDKKYKVSFLVHDGDTIQHGQDIMKITEIE